jgi:cytochrome P450
MQFTIYAVSLITYNLFFHPLRKFPGPWLAAASIYYYTYYTVIGERHLLPQRLHEEYGEIVRIAPNELSFIDEAAWKDIYGHKQGRPQLQKSRRRGPASGSYSILNAPDDAHARQRKMLSHAFSDRAVSVFPTARLGRPEAYRT